MQTNATFYKKVPSLKVTRKKIFKLRTHTFKRSARDTVTIESVCTQTVSIPFSFRPQLYCTPFTRFAEFL